MDDLLKQIETNASHGVKPTSFWITKVGESAEVRYDDGTTVGPFAYGDWWGPNADRDHALKLGSLLFRLGVMRPATSIRQSISMVTHEDLQFAVNQVFPMDLDDSDFDAGGRATEDGSELTI